MIVAVIPAKDLTNAKVRLSSCLTPTQRRELFCAMLEDVLVALRAAPSLAHTIVVTREPNLARLARSCGAAVWAEPANLGHTQAVRFAVDQLRGDPDVEAMLTIPGDVPLVTPAEIETILAESPPAPSAVLVPSRSGLGTNGVLLRPPDAMALRFGEPSFSNHVKLADEQGLARRILELPGLGLDVDTAQDLAIFRTLEGGLRTRRLLEELSMHGASETVHPHAH